MGGVDGRSIRSVWAIARKEHFTRSQSSLPGKSNERWFKRATKRRSRSVCAEMRIHFAIVLNEKENSHDDSA